MAPDRDVLLRNAEKLLRQGKLDQAIAEYRRIVDAQPRDWNTANVLGDLYFRAGQIDKAVAEYTRIADSLSLDGFLSKAGALYKKILKIRPDNEYVLLQAAEIAAGQELLVDARAYLNAVCEQRRRRGDAAGLAAVVIRLAALDPADYGARLTGARAQVETGDVTGAVASLKQLSAELTEQGLHEQALIALREAAPLAPADVEIKISLARLLADQGDKDSADEASRMAVELSEAAIGRGDWAGAAETLQQSLKRSPSDIALLMRLVEVGVDGGLHDMATAAQRQLADAYLAAGSAVEARFIAEDLLTRHPDDQSNIERLRRALTMLGEADPEAVIATRLAGFEPLAIEPREPIGDDRPAGEPAVTPRPIEPPKEVDLSITLEEFKAVPVIPPPVSKDLDDVFADLRKEATQRLAMNNPDQQLGAGLALYRAGQFDLAVPQLEAASRVPASRFAAAATLGRMFLERGDTWHAIEWLERAAEAPAPTPADGHRLLYELADALEGAGEVARALAICLELRAEAGEYQDVADRVDRLARVQARG